MAPASELVITDAVVRRTTGFQLGPVSLTIRRSDCLGLVGANGSGKTTLMRAVLGTVPLTSGGIAWEGKTVVAGRPTAGVAGMLEEPRLLPHVDGITNLKVAFPQRSLSRSECRDAMVRVGLAGHDSLPAGRYSQGMRQRLGLARLLLASPGLMVIDEPTNGLDPKGIRWFRSLLKELRDQGTTVLVSSHLLHEVQAVATHFLMLESGRVFQHGEITDLGDARTLEDYYFATLDEP